ncbi:unnamed protein product [Pocillopora meandrina]|uniref:Uncharacterized protein n=1 Tax=Pocillopora meandrina TaxID=46732 RepID=A0AAU9W812_9CNID|nr:unnamed protein product [Pocillopora meandrina]
MMVNISDDNQQAEFAYLGKGSPLIRIIKLLKGENGTGTCYHANPWCKENYGLRHSGEKTLNITLRDITKSMEGCYSLYPYCLGFNHHCTIDQPLKSFMLSVKDKPEPTKVTTVEMDSGSTEQVFSGKPSSTQASTNTGSGSKEPVSKGSTNHVIIAVAVSAAIILAILIVFLVVFYVHPSFRVHISRLYHVAYTRTQSVTHPK